MGYALESVTRILNMVSTKKVNKTPYEIWHEKVSNLQDAQPFENTSKHQAEIKHDEVDPLTDVNHVRRSSRIPQEPERYGFYVDVEEHELGDQNIKAIRILIAIVVYSDYKIWQMDVKTAFLNGRLNKDVHMVQPKGFVNPKTIPMQPNVDLSSIMYVVRCTSPDVAFSHNLTSRYQQNSSESHWTAVKNILKYLRNTKDMFLVYGGDSITELSVTCYIDASWETDRDDLRSQMRYVFVMNGGVVDWKSSKQSTTVMSSMEAEYIVAVEAAIEAIWISKFISGVGFVPNNDRPMDIYCDNTDSHS
uniref:Retrotransposon protein, putative, Ty1-copia subclass n=1 Tax=Tanacetum cinerariifolium TaxID=118510 RepID=A0A6L2MX55_TANCI|nr:retrotransposon protein, putative, Ty1-copia subclass [Tanacetum cinerariifolium]